jgi:hypothetical protein
VRKQSAQEKAIKKKSGNEADHFGKVQNFSGNSGMILWGLQRE